MTTYAGDKYTIKIVQGNDWNYPLTFSTSLLGVKTPMNLTGATVTGVVRPTYTSGTPVSMTTVITDAAAGKVTFSLTDTQTNALPPGALVYDMSITIAGNTKTYLSGNFQVKPKVQTV
jgi:hypothetical protein